MTERRSDIGDQGHQQAPGRMNGCQIQHGLSSMIDSPALPDVAEAALIFIPAPKRSERPLACIVLHPGNDP